MMHIKGAEYLKRSGVDTIWVSSNREDWSHGPGGTVLFEPPSPVDREKRIGERMKLTNIEIL